jgi:hypothetical protein
MYLRSTVLDFLSSLFLPEQARRREEMGRKGKGREGKSREVSR